MLENNNFVLKKEGEILNLADFIKEDNKKEEFLVPESEILETGKVWQFIEILESDLKRKSVFLTKKDLEKIVTVQIHNQEDSFKRIIAEKNEKNNF